MPFIPLPLVALLVSAGLSRVGAGKDFKPELLPTPQPSLRNTKTSLNMEQQKSVWDKAEDKRARRQARNLCNAGLTQEATL